MGTYVLRPQKGRGSERHSGRTNPFLLLRGTSSVATRALIKR